MTIDDFENFFYPTPCPGCGSTTARLFWSPNRQRSQCRNCCKDDRDQRCAGVEAMKFSSAEEQERDRKEYNAAVANGLILRARHIDWRMKARERT
jgi:hypothetical protein